MISLEDFVKLENFEEYLFSTIGGELIYEDLNSIGLPYYDDSVWYSEYQELLETLNRSSEFELLIKDIEKNFGKNIILQSENNRGRLILILNNDLSKDEQFKSFLNRNNYFISLYKELDNDTFKIILEPNFYNNVSDKINDNSEFLYHVISDNNVEDIIKSFKKKGGIKPGKRNKKSFHYRRVYMFRENIPDNDLLNIGKQIVNANSFLLIQFNLKAYIEEKNRRPKWHIDPNTKDDYAIWTSEIIPYQYLKFIDINDNKIPTKKDWETNFIKLYNQIN